MILKYYIIKALTEKTLIYTREFLIDAFLWRYTDVVLAQGCEAFDKLVEITNATYDKYGKDKFREYCSLDAAEIKKFRLATGY